MKYHYVGTTRTREKVRGVIEAGDEYEAKLRLRGMQIRAEKISEEKKSVSLNFSRTFNFISPINLKGLSIFTRQFSSLIQSGIPILQCIDILFEQEKNKAFKNALKKIKNDIEAGNSLSAAMDKYRNIFSPFYIAVIQSGEISGTLDKSLLRLTQQLEKLGKIKRKVFAALLYPLLTVVVSLFVLIFLIVKVIPEVTKLYGNQKLPELTQSVLNLSFWVQSHFLIIIGSAISFSVISGILYRTDTFRMFWDPLWLKVPIFGSLSLRSIVARFSRTLGTLLESGVPLMESFQICENMINNKAVRRSIHEAKLAVSEGRSIAQGLANEKLFPLMVIHMISIGEVTGRLDEMLSKLAEIYEDEVDDSINTVTTLIQPILILIVGGLVAFLLIAMYLPILSLAEKIVGG